MPGDHGVSTQRWKRQEREIAAALGGMRLPNSGAGQPDVRLPGYAVQVKTRESLSAWLTAAVDQAARDADAGEVPIVVLSEVSQGRKARRYALMAFGAWRAMTTGDRSPQAGDENTGVVG